MPSSSMAAVIKKSSTIIVPSYKPTPISELQKRHIPVTFNHDSERIRSKTHIRKKTKIEYVEFSDNLTFYQEQNMDLIVKNPHLTLAALRIASKSMKLKHDILDDYQVINKSTSRRVFSYKPTPISELQKQHIPVTLRPDSERIRDGQSLTELSLFTNGTSKPPLSADSNIDADQVDPLFEKSAMESSNEEKKGQRTSISTAVVIKKSSTIVPSYKPTPISELRKRHIPVTFNPDSERIRSKTHIRKKTKIEYVPRPISGNVPVVDYKPTPSNTTSESKFIYRPTSTSHDSDDLSPSQVEKMDLIIKNPNLKPSEISLENKLPSSLSSNSYSFDEFSDDLTSSQEQNMELIVKNPHLTPTALGITSKSMKHDILDDDSIAKEIDMLGEILAANGVESGIGSLEFDCDTKIDQIRDSSEEFKDDDGGDDNTDNESMQGEVQHSDLDDNNDRKERIPGPIETERFESNCNFTKTVRESEKSGKKSDKKNLENTKSKSRTTSEDNKNVKSSKHSSSSKNKVDKHSDSRKKGLTNSDQKKQDKSEKNLEKVEDKQIESSHHSNHKTSSSKSSDKSHSLSNKHGSSSSKVSDKSHKSLSSSNKHRSTSSKSSDRSHSSSNKHVHRSSSHKDEKSDTHPKKDESSRDAKTDRHSKKDESCKDDKSIKHLKKDELSKDDKSIKHSKKDESSKDEKPDKHSKIDKCSRDAKTDRHSHERKDESKMSRKISSSEEMRDSEKCSQSDLKKDESHKKVSKNGKYKERSHSDKISESNRKESKKSRTDKYSSNNNNNEKVIENREKDIHRKRKHSSERNHHHSSSRHSKKSKRDEQTKRDKSTSKSHTHNSEIDSNMDSDHSSDVEEIIEPVVTISLDSSDESMDSSTVSTPVHEPEDIDHEPDPTSPGPEPQPETHPLTEEHLEEIPSVRRKIRMAHSLDSRSSSQSVPEFARNNSKKYVSPSEALLKRYHEAAASTASATKTLAEIPAHQGGQRVRIAHVPNVDSLLDSRKQLLKGFVAQNANSSRQGAEGAAAANSALKSKEPLPIVANVPNCAIPLAKRQNFLGSIYDSYCQIYDIQTAKQKAVTAEEEIAKTATNITYRDKVAQLRISLKKDAAILSGGLPVERRARNEDPLIPPYTYGKPLYDCFLKYLVEDLYAEGIPVAHPTEPGCARMKVLYNESLLSFNKPYNICINCGQKFSVDENDFSVERRCAYHLDKKQRTTSVGSRFREYYWACCRQNKPCVVSEYHIRDNMNYNMMPGFVKTPPCPKNLKFPGIYALDCEMCHTTKGHELTRVTVINHEREVVYESYCKPRYPILDYCTRFSGVEEKHLVNVTTTLQDIQSDLFEMFNEKTILIGHSIGSDLKALKIIHTCVVDTSCVFTSKISEYKRKLRDLAVDYLKRQIQEAVTGHCSEEDALAALDLMIYKIKEDCKADKPRTIISLETQR